MAKSINTVQAMYERIELLSREMDHNDEENRFMQQEIDDLYEMIDNIEGVDE